MGMAFVFVTIRIVVMSVFFGRMVVAFVVVSVVAMTRMAVAGA